MLLQRSERRRDREQSDEGWSSDVRLVGRIEPANCRSGHIHSSRKSDVSRFCYCTEIPLWTQQSDSANRRDGGKYEELQNACGQDCSPYRRMEVTMAGASSFHWLLRPWCQLHWKSDELWRHCKTCHHRKQGSDDQSTGVLCKARMLLEGGLQEEGNVGDKGMQDLHNHVLLTMRKDAAFKALKEDTLILQFGNVMLRKLGTRRKNDVAQRMRQLSRLKRELPDDGWSIQLTNYLTDSCFGEVVSAVEIVAGMQENTQGICVFDIPSLALSLGHNLLKCAEPKRGLGIRQQNSTTKAEAETFIQLHSSEWTDKVSSIALATLKTNNFNKPEMLPITADLVLLKNFLMKTTDDLNNEICKSPTYECWRALAEATLSRVILFNKRRGSEASKLLLQTYVSRPNWAASANMDVFGINTVEFRCQAKVEETEAAMCKGNEADEVRCPMHSIFWWDQEWHGLLCPRKWGGKLVANTV